MNELDPRVRIATVADADVIGALLHRFNIEFESPTPGVAALATRLSELIQSSDTEVLLADEGRAGLVVSRFRKAIWSAGLECYVAELYVIPERRREGLGRALMTGAMVRARGRGADWIDLGTEETDTAARALYESLGFTNRENGDGALSYCYGREL